MERDQAIGAVRQQVLDADPPLVVSRTGVQKHFSEHCLSSNSHIRRFLEARNWDVDVASKMLLRHISWRRAFFPVEMTPGVQRVLQASGGIDETYRLRFLGYNCDGRPTVAINCFHGEFLEDDVTVSECTCAFIDFFDKVLMDAEEAGKPTRMVVIVSGGAPPGRFAKRLIRIVEANYPETCHACILYPVPWALRMLAATAFWIVPQKLRDKMKLLTEEREMLHAASLTREQVPEDLRGGMKALKMRLKFDRGLLKNQVNQWKYVFELLEQDGFGGSRGTPNMFRAFTNWRARNQCNCCIERMGHEEYDEQSPSKKKDVEVFDDSERYPKPHRRPSKRRSENVPLHHADKQYLPAAEVKRFTSSSNWMVCTTVGCRLLKVFALLMLELHFIAALGFWEALPLPAAGRGFFLGVLLCFSSLVVFLQP